VIDKLGPVNYRIQKSPKADPIIVHVDKLKMFEGTTPNSWLLQPTSSTALADLNNCMVEDTTPNDSLPINMDDLLEQGPDLFTNGNATTAATVTLPDEEQTLRPRRITRQPVWLTNYVCD